MRSKLKWYWKFLIIIILMFIVGSCTNKGFIINTYAKSKEKFNREIVFYDDNDNRVYPTINNSGVYYSNYISEESLTSLWNGNYNPYTTYSWNDIKLEDGEILSSTSTTSDIKAINYLSGSSTSGHFIYGFDLNSWIYDSLIPGEFKKGSQYTFLFEFSKNNKLFYKRGKDYNTDDFNVSGTIFSKYNYGGLDVWRYNLEDIFDIDSVEWITPDIGDDDTPYAFLKVVISTNDMFPSGTGKYYKLTNMKITFKDSDNPVVGDYVNISGGYDYFIGSTSGTSNSFIINKFYLIEDLNVSIGEIDYTGASGSMLSQTKYKKCDNLDFACHLDNLSTGIKSITENLMYNIRKILEYLFIPEFSQLQTIFSDFIEVVDDKLGIVAYPVELLANIVNRFLSLNPTTLNSISISIPEVRDPFYNNVLIQSGTWNIGQIISTGNIYQLYLIYKMFITAYIIYLFICLCYDSFSSFIAGDGGRVSAYTIQMVDSCDDTGETYDSYIKSHKFR